MARLDEKGAEKAPRCNAGKRTSSAYLIMQASKGRARQIPGMAALREIRKYKKTMEMLNQKAPLQRLVREFIKKETYVL
jgi:hypothetical protein